MTPSSDAKRILHVIAPVPAGGAESVVRGLVRGGKAAADGAAPLVAALLQDSAPSPFVEQLRRDGSEVREVRCGRRRYFAEAAAVARIAGETGAGIIHTHVYHGDVVGYLSSRKAKRPVVATVHGFTGGDWKNRLYQFIDQRLLRRFDAVIAVSESVRAALLQAGVKQERIHLIPNAWQPTEPLSRSAARSALGLAGDARVAGWVGRLSPEKGPDLFLKALATPTSTSLTGVMIGDGAELEGLRGLRDSLGLTESRLSFAGARADAASLMPAFDVMVLSSRTEGTPMALLEAMGAGVPVVAFAVGGIPQVIDEHSGWLVPPDNPAALGTAISDALARPEEGRRRAMRAREVLQERFGAERWMERIGKVYRAVGAA